MQNVISCNCSIFNKANPVPIMLEYDSTYYADYDYDDDDWHEWVLTVVYYPADLYENGYNISFDLMEY